MSILCEWSQEFSSEIKEGVAKRQLNRKEDVRDQSVGIMVIMPELRAQRSEIIEETGPREENMLGTDWGTETGRRRQLRRCGKSTWGGITDGEDCVSRGSNFSSVGAPAERYRLQPED